MRTHVVVSRHRDRGALVAGVVTAVVAGLVSTGAGPGSAAARQDIDPGALPRGADPAVVHMVRDTIRDGDLRVPATQRRHDQLWRTERGYVVKDIRGDGEPGYRLVRVSRTGDKLVLTRNARAVAVSGVGRRIAWSEELGRYGGPPTRVVVADAHTGRRLAVRRFEAGAHVVAVTGHRVLLSRLGTAHRGTLWWNLERDSLRRIWHKNAVSVDLDVDRIVFDIPRDAPACNRVTPFSDFTRTLWRSCDIYPRAWSPDGEHAVATYTYFDDVGTILWRTIDATTGKPVGAVTGRLDWTAVWEDSDHFLTMAQDPDGPAAVIRCSVAGVCERASKLWDRGPVDSQPNYIGPPVVLAEN